jgi:hypothetical protein
MTTKAAEAHYIKSVADYIAMSAIKNSYAFVATRLVQQAPIEALSYRRDKAWTGSEVLIYRPDGLQYQSTRHRNRSADFSLML